MAQVIPKIGTPLHKIEEFCQKWKISEFALFGSILRDDFTPESDVDVLVAFLPEARYSLFDMVHMENELREIFGRNVDLVEKEAIQRSKNYIRRKNILTSLQVLYAA